MYWYSIAISIPATDDINNLNNLFTSKQDLSFDLTQVSYSLIIVHIYSTTDLSNILQSYNFSFKFGNYSSLKKMVHRNVHDSNTKKRRKLTEFKEEKNDPSVLIKQFTEYFKNTTSKCLLLYSCMQGYYDLLKYLIDIKYHFTPDNIVGSLYIATTQNYINIVEILLSTFPYQINDIPISIAIELGTIDIIELFLTYDNIINTTTPDNSSLLHIACQYEQFDVVKLLIDNNCSINSQNDIGYTPLHFACEYKCFPIVKYLIDNNCSINDKDIEGDTPLHLAANNGFERISQYLIESNALINETNYLLNTPLHLASSNDYIEIVQLLINNNCKRNPKNTFHYIPIQCAAENGSINVVKYLMENNYCDIDFDYNHTPLHCAAHYGHKSIVEYLIKQNVAINIIDDNNYTPLLSSIDYASINELYYNNENDIENDESINEHERYEIVKYILEHKRHEFIQVEKHLLLTTLLKKENIFIFNYIINYIEDSLEDIRKYINFEASNNFKNKLLLHRKKKVQEI